MQKKFERFQCILKEQYFLIYFQFKKMYFFESMKYFKKNYLK